MLYILCLSALLLASDRLRQRLRISSILFTPVLTVSGLCFAMVLPGAVGALTRAGFLVVMILIVALLLALPSVFSGEKIESDDREQSTGKRLGTKPLIVLIVLLALSLPGAIALGGYLKLCAENLIDDKACTLSWDSVSYHIPGVVEFFKKKTLWTFDGPYQSYCFGFDLVCNIPTMLSYSIFGVALGNVFAAIFLIASCLTLYSQAGRWAHPRGGSRILRIGVGAALVFALGYCEDHFFRMFGKNDVFLAACLVASLSLLLGAFLNGGGKMTRRDAFMLVGSALALSLALASKSNALAYLPLWVGSVVGLKAARRENGIERQRLSMLWLSVVAILVLGCFFFLRNLWAFGKITANLQVALGNTPTLLTELLKRRLTFAQVLETWPHVLQIVAGLLGFAGLLRSSERKARLCATLSLVWLIYGTGIYLITPFSAAMGKIDWRFAVFPTALGISGTAAYLGVLTARLDQSRETPDGALVSLRRSFGYWPALGVCLLIVAVCFAGRRRLIELHGYNFVRGKPIGVYAYLRSRKAPLRIYSVGLRPLGVFGNRLQHTVFYDLNPPPLAAEETGIARLRALRKQFDPDLILLSVDARSNTDASRIPMADWLQRQPCVHEVFRDSVSAAYEIDRKCGQKWEGEDDGAPTEKVLMSP